MKTPRSPQVLGQYYKQCDTAASVNTHDNDRVVTILILRPNTQRAPGHLSKEHTSLHPFKNKSALTNCPSPMHEAGGSYSQRPHCGWQNRKNNANPVSLSRQLRYSRSCCLRLARHTHTHTHTQTEFTWGSLGPRYKHPFGRDHTCWQYIASHRRCSRSKLGPTFLSASYLPINLVAFPNAGTLNTYSAFAYFIPYRRPCDAVLGLTESRDVRLFQGDL